MIVELSKETQFIIITHNKRTMCCGDQIIGVTMQPPGVSRKVSVRFSKNGEPVFVGDADGMNLKNAQA